MGLARSEGDRMEMEVRRRDEDRRREERRLRREEERRIAEERDRRLSHEPPASPATQQQPGPSTRRYGSPARSVRSQRTTSSTLRLRLAEFQEAEKLAEITRKQMEIDAGLEKQKLALEADLIRKKAAVEKATIEDEEGSVRGVNEDAGTVHNKVGEWLNNTPLQRGERGARRNATRPLEEDGEWRRRERSRTPGRDKIEQPVEPMQRMSTPQYRGSIELPTFDGALGDWLTFKAAMQDSTELYNLRPIENILRLRSCLKGEARESVATLLFSTKDPNAIMRSLEQSFGRPDFIVDRVMADLRKLPRIGMAAAEINKFAVRMQNAVCAVQEIGGSKYLENPLLIGEVLEKLDPIMRARWMDYAKANCATTEPTIVLLSRFLLDEADMALRYNFSLATSTSRLTANAGRKKPAVYTIEECEGSTPCYAIEAPPPLHRNEASAPRPADETPTPRHPTEAPTSRCPGCGGAHALAKCRHYLALPVSQRWDMVCEKGICFRCIDSTHRRFQCKAKLCGVKRCRLSHHASLHDEKATALAAARAAAPAPRSAAPSTNSERDNDAVVLSVAPDNATDHSEVLLKVCPVIVSGPSGEIETYALLDEGATISLIDNELAGRVGASGPTRPLNLSGVSANMSQQEDDSREVEVFVRGKGENALFKLRGRTIRDLSLRKQTVPRDLLRYAHLRGLREEEVSYDPARPRILVGSDHWQLIVSRELRIGGPEQPAASRTQLGWVVHGTAPRSAIYAGEESVLHVYAPALRVCEREEHDRRLSEQVERHFAIDTLGVAPRPRVSDADQRAIETFARTVSKVDGGYEVGLPWRKDAFTMPPSYAAAANRLRGIERNARVHAETHPRALVAITQSHYMDDYADSYSDEAEAKRTIAEVRVVHAVAGFTLRGWCANSESVLSDVPSELCAKGLSQLGGASADHKILGLYWHAATDELAFNTAMHRVPIEVRELKRAPTKREALSVVMSIYDPLGLLSQYTVRAKIVLQCLWRLQVPWDEPLPAEEAERFDLWLRQLSEITKLRIPRCYNLEGARELELHVMCDASEQAYATVAYWRATRHDGGVSLALVAAKAKVAPKKTLSIPRLELQAAVIGARLADTIKREHRVEPLRTVYWTDSATVVHWVKNDARRYTPFVAHRLGEIAELSHRDEWRWLPTESNVADDATRLRETPVDASDRWFRGPSFLLSQEAEWPSQRVPREDEDVAEVLHTSERDESSSQWTPEPARFSSYERLVRATARVLAFVDLCQRRATRLELEHIERAERALMRRAQEESFADDLQRLKAGRPITRTSRLYRLDPVLEDGLLRVRGRINASNVPVDAKRPIILDGRHAVTRLLVLREHCHAGHANRERVTNDLRQRYWVVHLRPTVRAVESKCALCRVRKARPRVPTTGDLPKARVDPFHRPFTNCGLDYFGPMTIKIGRRREKRWGALFTCLTTRAVHLELVESLSTDSAIMAVRRMAARRGWPRLMYSDNATNFRGADQELRRAYAEWAPSLREEGLLHRMKWTYIPPGAPNQGGAWERLVRSVKAALAVTLREKVPTAEVLQTLLTEAEYSINARPLTHVSVSARDPEALTPNHFLMGTSTGLPTTGACNEADRRTWRASQALADSFWRRWVREYLPTLVPRGEPTDLKTRLEVGDIVVVVDPTMPRNVWPIGQVEKTYPGPDGGVRVADVRTKSGLFRRPTSKLAVLLREKEEATRAAPGGGC